MSKLRRSASFNPGMSNSVYRHPPRVHLLPPPEVTRLRTLTRPAKAKRAGNGTLDRRRSDSPFRKLPLPEIFYNNAELEEKADISDSEDEIKVWEAEDDYLNYNNNNSSTHVQQYPYPDHQEGEEQGEEEREQEEREQEERDRDNEYIKMVSRRAILTRSRDDMQSHLVGSPQDQWFSRERLYKDHINEVLGKWQNIEDSIWAKVIVLERNRRIAKAYARTPVLTVNGSQDGFDGYRIGLNGFANPLRDAKVTQVKSDIGAGCKLKMDDGGNILVKRVDNNGVYVKNTAEETAVSNDILKLPGGLLERDRAVKLFDMKKFQQNINRELKRQRPERNKLESQCISTLAFVRSEMDILDCPIWIMVINIVAMEMLGDRMPVDRQGIQLPMKKRAVNSSSDEDPYSLTQSGSSGYSGMIRDPVYASNLQAFNNNVQMFTGDREGEEDDIPEIYPTNNQIYNFTTLMRPGRQKERQARKTGYEKEEEEQYYNGFSAKMTDFSNKIKRERAQSKDNFADRGNNGSSVSPWWHSRLYPDSGVDLSSVGSAGSPSTKQKLPPRPIKQAGVKLPGERGAGKLTDLHQGSYLPGQLRNGGMALKTKELSSFQDGGGRPRRNYNNFFTTPRTLFNKQNWE